MKARTKYILLAAAVAVPLIVALTAYRFWWHATHYVVERKEYHDAPEQHALELTDDRLEDKAPAFDDSLVDSRPLGDWQVNASAAVIRLDSPNIKPDIEDGLLALHASYADAMQRAETLGCTLLPSANLVDGAAKQFDDGLYAALDLACYRGELGLAPPPAELIRILFDGLPMGSPARPFLAAALELAGTRVILEHDQEEAKDRFLSAFAEDRERSKPISFYNWTPELQEVWRFYRFLQHEFDEQSGIEIAKDIAAALGGDPRLLNQYRAINGFYGRLTNPLICLPVDALIDTTAPLDKLAKEWGARWLTVAVFPPSTSRETELFAALFPLGLPDGVNLMAEFIRRVRSGEIDLAPAADDGWYQYQAHALEAMLMPATAQEKDKLLLTAKYKKRLLEAFKALVTKRRETHARQLAVAKALSAAEPIPAKQVRPRLRIEPCATFYLRTARAYAFLQDFLSVTIGQERLDGLRGLRKDGARELGLADELDLVRRRFYGFYVIACEDIGMRPTFLDDEPVEPEAAKSIALAWLDNLGTDADLACDTRVAVPIFVDLNRPDSKTCMWATLGVRLAHLEASYARPPKVRPLAEGGPWQEVEPHQLGDSRYVIPVDEFAEFEIAGSNALTREELRTMCDQHGTKAAILQALDRRFN